MNTDKTQNTVNAFLIRVHLCSSVANFFFFGARERNRTVFVSVDSRMHILPAPRALVDPPGFQPGFQPSESCVLYDWTTGREPNRPSQRFRYHSLTVAAQLQAFLSRSREQAVGHGQSRNHRDDPLADAVKR